MYPVVTNISSVSGSAVPESPSVAILNKIVHGQECLLQFVIVISIFIRHPGVYFHGSLR